MTRPHASHVGSSVMIPTGKVSSALAKSESAPFVGVGEPPSESLPTTNTVITTVTAITATRSMPPIIHLPLPLLGGGPGGGPHGCCGPHCGAPPGGGPHCGAPTG